MSLKSYKGEKMFPLVYLEVQKMFPSGIAALSPAYYVTLFSVVTNGGFELFSVKRF